MLRRFTYSVIQSRGIKHQVNIKWVKPEYKPTYVPEKSGDLEGVPSVPDTAIGVDYALSEEMKNASDAIKKLFSVAHLGKKQHHALMRKELMDRVRRHEYDESTAEIKIARLTGHIRYLQETMDKYPRNKKMKAVVQEIIDRRKKLLKYLRQYDYKKFEWLLEKLNIEYKAHPESSHKLTRKESLRKLTELHCDEIRNQKLSDYRNLLESQQGPYLEQKLDALKFIRSEQIELQMPITVTEQDIKKVETQLEEWKVRENIKLEAKKKRRNLILDVE